MADKQLDAYSQALDNVTPSTLMDTILSMLPSIGPNRTPDKIPPVDITGGFNPSDMIQGLVTKVLDTVMTDPNVSPKPTKQPDAYTQALDKANPFDITEAGALARMTQQQLLSAMSVGAQLPDQPPEVVKSLMLDSAVADTNTAIVNSVSGKIGSTDLGLSPQPTPTDPNAVVTGDAVTGDVTKELSGTMGTKFTPPTTPSEVQLSARAQHMLKSFQGAFPGKQFSVTEKDGIITVEDKPSQIMIPTVPTNYSEPNATKGLDDLKVALTKVAGDPQKELTAAYALKAAATTHSAAKYQMYVNQANAENNIPNLEQMLANSRQLDAMSPTVRASGAPSAQTYNILQDLGKARMVAATRTEHLMKTDPSIIEANALADQTISRLQQSMVLDQKQDADVIRTQNQMLRKNSIAEQLANPSYLNRFAILSSGAPITPGHEGIWAERVVDKKVSLDPVSQMIAGTPTEDLRRLYLQGDLKMKDKVSRVMLYEEAQATKDKSVNPVEDAKQQMVMFNKIMSDKTPLPEELKVTLNKLNAETTLAYTGTERAKHLVENNSQVRLDYAMQMVIAQHNDNVMKWDGTVKGDTTSQAIFQQVAKSAPGQPLPLKSFITNYMNYGDGLSRADKITALRGIVSSSVDALPNSVIFPKPSVQSFLSLVDRINAQSMTERAIGLLSSGISGASYLNPATAIGVGGVNAVKYGISKLGE